MIIFQRKQKEEKTNGLRHVLRRFFLKERGWEFRPAQKIQGVFKPIGKYDAKNPAQDDFSIYDNNTLKKYHKILKYAEAQGKTWRY